uniref:Immunoglobulin V-set domain-containing protein n=1 Tax=Sinocyclocheilus grahami TaxID=75366 RepID=A0A672MHY0_SINGR
KGQYKDSSIILTSDGGESSVSEGRFSLRDDHQTRSFTVTIRDLRMADAGEYACRAGWGEYKRFQLNVIKAAHSHCTSLSLSLSLSLSVSDTSNRTGRGNLGQVAVYQNVQHNTETELMYDEIPNSDVITSASSSNQTPASHLNTRPQVSDVYATVTNQRPDSNPSLIHSANQVTDTDCDYYASMKPPETTPDNRTELIYSTATHPQNVKTNDGPIYSIIKHK